MTDIERVELLARLNPSDSEEEIYDEEYQSFTPGTSQSRIGPQLAVCFLLAIFLGYVAVRSAVKPSLGSTHFFDPSRRKKDVPRTILISIDGFRFDYLHRIHKTPGSKDRVPLAPTLSHLALNGAFSLNGMKPVMPSITFPNHWSIATGLYPESSGIVANVMFDPKSKEWFRYNEDEPRWWKGEPIWHTLRLAKAVSRKSSGDTPGERESRNYTTATVFWPGSSLPVKRPNVHWKYNSSVSYGRRVQRVLSLIRGTANDLHGNRADFVTLYFEGVDHAGHMHGPFSKMVNSEIARVDAAISDLLKGLGPNATKKFNIIVVSDHGMAPVSEKRTIEVTQPSSAHTVVSSPFGMYFNINRPVNVLYNTMRSVLFRYRQHITVYKKENLPWRWHLRHAEMVMPVVTLTAVGWGLSFKHSKGHHLPHDRSHRPDNPVHGEHGYDNALKEMRALFIGAGPSFKQGARMRNLESVDVYAMICSIFCANPAPNNGSLSRAQELLVSP